MCWRDNQSSDERWAEFRRVQEGYQLRQADARPDDEIHVDLDYSTGTERRYFRRKTVRFLSGPMDTTEVILKTGVEVLFTHLPGRAQAENGVNSTRAPARVTIRGKKIGFIFKGKSGRKPYFPLQTKDFVRFTVLSLPRKKKAI